MLELESPPVVVVGVKRGETRPKLLGGVDEPPPHCAGMGDGVEANEVMAMAAADGPNRP